MRVRVCLHVARNYLYVPATANLFAQKAVNAEMQKFACFPIPGSHQKRGVVDGLDVFIHWFKKEKKNKTRKN